MRQLSPLRNSTSATNRNALAEEQARHFGIDPDSDYGKALIRLAATLYDANLAAHDLWRVTMAGLEGLDRTDRIAWFNAKRFISFQLAKILDTMQNPLRATYQSVATHKGGFAARGAYPLFDNVTAIFSASAVITRTATYLFACTEWVEDAFKGREPLHEIYSRLLNPTSISLANHIVDIECGAQADQYMAWNFNSGMAAIDAILSHLVGREDIILSSRNIYGGTYQLLHDWFAKSSNLDVALEWVDAFDGAGFAEAMDRAAEKYGDRLAKGRRIYVFLESPCNPHGFVLDVPGIARAAHERGWRVIADSTVGTPLLHPLLRRADPIERPDFVVHSYTKELSGTGVTTAGVVIGPNADMFLPKGASAETVTADGAPRSVNWDETLFWNVYYIKGGFLDSDKAFEVLNGMKTFEIRVLQKAINTMALAKILDAHPDINVSCPALPASPNHAIQQAHMWLGLPAALFTIDVEGKGGRAAILRVAYKKFLDMLEPAVGMQVSLGQTNTVALCPAMTTHSELSDTALKDAGISPTSTRISVGLEDPRILVAHMQRAAEIAIDPVHPGFSGAFPAPAEIDRIYRETYLDIQERFLAAVPGYAALVS
jgi:O-acetylhomoserine/O-acetylserine sulfhydrylase-like pyridoxal-dependent enzyme